METSLNRFVAKISWVATVKQKVVTWKVQDTVTGDLWGQDKITLDGPERNITLTPSKETSIDSLGLINESVIVDIDYESGGEYHDLASWDEAQFPGKDWFNIHLTEKNFYFALGVPYIIQVVMDWGVVGEKFNFGYADVAVEVDGQELLTGLKTWTEKSPMPSPHMMASAYIFGMFSQFVEGKSLTIKVYLGERFVGNANQIYTMLRVNVMRYVSNLFSTLNVLPVDFPPITLLEHIQQELADRKSVV